MSEEQLKGANDADAVVAIAKDAGFTINRGDIKNTQSELSEKELEGVARGADECMRQGRQDGNLDIPIIACY